MRHSTQKILYMFFFESCFCTVWSVNTRVWATQPSPAYIFLLRRNLPKRRSNMIRPTLVTPPSPSPKIVSKIILRALIVPPLVVRWNPLEAKIVTHVGPAPFPHPGKWTENDFAPWPVFPYVYFGTPQPPTWSPWAGASGYSIIFHHIPSLQKIGGDIN